jgi:hypothetical protein
MKRFDYSRLGNHLWLEVLAILIGALMISSSFLADYFGMGNQTGFGTKQVILLILGGGMLLVTGGDLIARKNGWDPEIPTLAEITAILVKQCAKSCLYATVYTKPGLMVLLSLPLW